MKTILITGGAGFIGSFFTKYMVTKHPDIVFVNLDLLTYAGNLLHLSPISSNKNHIFIHGDIRDQSLVDSLFDKYQFDAVVHFAAETHVDRSIANPEIFVSTNIVGTQILLNIAKKYWKVEPNNHNSRDFHPNVKFLHISTDEVYGSLGHDGSFTENSPLSPNSPYSASKASADLLVQSFHKTYGFPMNITRCSNNYGPFQNTEKLIPRMITMAKSEEKLPIYGDGLHIRDWLHVADHCSALELVLFQGKLGEVYNIGGNCELANLDLVKEILSQLGKDESLLSYVPDRPGHDRRYAINAEKISCELGWVPSYSFPQGLQETISFYENCIC